jgi:hypothetical protein
MFSCLHLHYSISLQKPFAAIMILHMRGATNATLVCQQLKYHNRNPALSKYFYVMQVMNATGSILRSFVFNSNIELLGGILYISSSVMMAAFSLKLLYTVVRRDMSPGTSAHHDWYNEGQQIAFGLLVVIIWIVSLLVVTRTSNDIGETLPEREIIGNIFVVVLCAIITNEYRYDFYQLNQKLTMKRMFV